MSVTITTAASDKISSLFDIHAAPVRFKVTSGGCQGFNKVWDLDTTKQEDDAVFRCGNGQLLIDLDTLEMIAGAVIDYKVSFGGAHFSVEIPSATSQCGCGTSFSI